MSKVKIIVDNSYKPDNIPAGYEDNMSYIDNDFEYIDDDSFSAKGFTIRQNIKMDLYGDMDLLDLFNSNDTDTCYNNLMNAINRSYSVYINKELLEKKKYIILPFDFNAYNEKYLVVTLDDGTVLLLNRDYEVEFNASANAYILTWRALNYSTIKEKDTLVITYPSKMNLFNKWCAKYTIKELKDIIHEIIEDETNYNNHILKVHNIIKTKYLSRNRSELSKKELEQLLVYQSTKKLYQTTNKELRLLASIYPLNDDYDNTIRFFELIREYEIRSNIKKKEGIAFE